MAEVNDVDMPPQPSKRLLTVGIPVFNGKSLLRNCLQSVVNSSLPRDRFEIVVVDDGSFEPETHAILREFDTSLKADPGFFRLISLGTNSGGAARPRNRVLDQAAGEYVFFVDADDTIGSLSLELIAEAVVTRPADWIALNQVAVNGRAAVCEIRKRHAEVPRAKALTTLTVHKVFRRAEIDRQGLRFDEGLPSGQDVSFAFSYILNAARFLMLGGYDYYYLTHHDGNPNEPGHLSRRADTAEALIEKNERILRSMLTALRQSELPESEQRDVIAQVALPRILIQEGYLKAVVNAGPSDGTRALRRLAKLLADLLLEGLDPAPLKGVTGDHLAVIAESDWAGLAQLLGPAATRPQTSVDARWAWGRRVVDAVSGRARHRQVVYELAVLRRFVEETRNEQRRLDAILQAEFHLRDMLMPGGSETGPAMTPPSSTWQSSSRAMQELVRQVLLDRPKVVVECGSGAHTLCIGRALRRAGEGRLISLASSADSAVIIRELIELEGLRNVDVRHTPMEATGMGQQERPPYAAADIADLDEIDLLVVDGRSGRPDDLAGPSALMAMREKLLPGATVMLNDGQQGEETLRRCIAEMPELSLIRRIEHIAVMKVS